MFDRLFIDKLRCSYLLDCLRQYHKEYDEKRKIYKSVPEHDRSSHCADAFRYLAINVEKLTKLKTTKILQAKRIR
jgi:hypothetical protein